MPWQLLAWLAAQPYVSGAELARQLGLARAAVWKQVEHLRTCGLPIEGQRGTGYCLPWLIQLLNAQRIRTWMQATSRALEVRWSLDSTSNECQRRAAELPDASIVMAQMQQFGRGRRWRAWLSLPGLNLRLPQVLRAHAGQPAADLTKLGHGDLPNRNQLAECVIDQLFEALRMFNQQVFMAFEDYARLDLLHDRPPRLTVAAGDFEAVGTGIGARGALRGRRGGAITPIDSAGVTVRAR